MRSSNRSKRSPPLGLGRVIALGCITVLAVITLILYTLTKDPLILEFCRWVSVILVTLAIGSARELLDLIIDLFKDLFNRRSRT